MGSFPLLLSSGTARGQVIGDAARRQIQTLVENKASRTAEQLKIDSNLLHAYKRRRGLEAVPTIRPLQRGFVEQSRGTVEVDITATVSDALLTTLKNLGAEIVSVYPAARSVHMPKLPFSALESAAREPDVLFIQPRLEPVFQFSRLPPEDRSPTSGRRGSATSARRRHAPGQRRRATAPMAKAALNVSEGDVAHRAALARSTFGVSGAGVEVSASSLTELPQPHFFRRQATCHLSSTLLSARPAPAMKGPPCWRSFTTWHPTPRALFRDGVEWSSQFRPKHSRSSVGGL